MLYSELAVNEIVTVSEAAQFLRKHPGTVRRWIESNKLKARHLVAGGHGIYAILRSDLLEFALRISMEEQERSKREPHELIDKNQRKLPF